MQATLHPIPNTVRVKHSCSTGSKQNKKSALLGQYKKCKSFEKHALHKT